MEDKTKNNWDVGTAIVTALLTLATILLGVHQFNDGELNKVVQASKLARENDEINYKRKLWLERLDAYRNVAVLTGTLVSHADSNPEALKKDLQDFDAAYWGSMILNEDKDVEQLMIEFRLAVSDFQKHRVDSKYLKIKADALIQKCKESLKSGAIDAEMSPKSGKKDY
jgi:hypothetical protein